MKSLIFCCCLLVGVGCSKSKPPPAEICGNAVDDDRDGQIDEGCQSPNPPAPPPAGTIAIDPQTTYQTMIGWEAGSYSGQLDETNGGPSSTFPLYKDALFDATVDLGINRFRLARELDENTVDCFAQFIAKQITFQQMNQCKSAFVNDNGDPNNLNLAGFQFSHLDHTIDNVVLPMRQRLAARGETLTTYLHGLFDPEARDYRTNAAEYGEFVLATYLHMRDKYGWVPDAVEVGNEPDGQNTLISPEQMGPMIVAAGTRLQQQGFTPRFVVPSVVLLQNTVPWYHRIVQSAPAAKAFIDVISYHGYAAANDNEIQAIGNLGRTEVKKTGMTEHIDRGYWDLYRDLTLANVSTWQELALLSYFTVASPTPTTPVVTPDARAKALRQYFKHVRPGAVRIGAASGSAAFQPVAFRNTNGRHVVVVKADAGGNFSISNLPAGTYGIFYTTESQYNVTLPDVAIGAGGTISTGIPAAGVLTVHATTAGTSSPPISLGLIASGRFSTAVTGRLLQFNRMPRPTDAVDHGARSDVAARNRHDRVWDVVALENATVLMRSDLIDLTRAPAVRLGFDSWLDARISRGDVQMSTDGVNWVTISGVPPSDTWQPLDVDLSPFAGHTVQVQFVFHGVAPRDGSTPDRWRLANISVGPGQK